MRGRLEHIHTHTHTHQTFYQQRARDSSKLNSELLYNTHHTTLHYIKKHTQNITHSKENKSNQIKSNQIKSNQIKTKQCYTNQDQTRQDKTRHRASTALHCTVLRHVESNHSLTALHCAILNQTTHGHTQTQSVRPSLTRSLSFSLSLFLPLPLFLLFMPLCSLSILLANPFYVLFLRLFLYLSLPLLGPVPPPLRLFTAKEAGKNPAKLQVTANKWKKKVSRNLHSNMCTYYLTGWRLDTAKLVFGRRDLMFDLSFFMD